MSRKSYLISIGFFLLVLFVWCAILQTISTAEAFGEEGVRVSGSLVKREQRRTLVSTEDGEILAVRVADNINGSYLLHFFTLEPNSLFLPALLHADMVFYVHTGSGKLSWTEEDDDLKSTELKRGDVNRLEQGAVFFIHSNLETSETERNKLRIHAIFANSKNDLHEPATGPYSSIRDMALGFDKQVLKAAFKVPEEVIDELLNGTNAPAIVHGLPNTKRAAAAAAAFEMEAQSLLGSTSYNIFELNKKKKKKKKSSVELFNLFKEDKDFENCNGWSTTITRKKLSALKGSDFGLFMVNLTAGSMMGPHWNPTATEIGVVLQGRGMIRVVCSSISNETRCRNMRFEVEEGDVFAVPRFHPMAQISFNNETLVFVGFSTSANRNHPQFLAGQASVFRSLDKDVLAMSFNVTNTTLDQLLAPQHESVILGCVSCAEGELRIMEEEIEREMEEAREREEEETRRREEEEARKREEAAAKREEEERRRREEEERQREEEERERQQEEARRREEEEARKEEEERIRREEEEEKRRKEEEAARKEEEERTRREKEERQREEEEEAARQREEKKERQREEEEGRKEEEVARREEEERIRREKEEKRRQEKKEQEQEEEEARRRHQEQEEQEEAASHREEQQRRGRSEEEQAEEERRREEEAQREEEEGRQQERERGEEEGRETEWVKIIRILKKRLTV